MDLYIKDVLIAFLNFGSVGKKKILMMITGEIDMEKFLGFSFLAVLLAAYFIVSHLEAL